MDSDESTRGARLVRGATVLPASNADVLPHIPRDPRRWREVLAALLRLHNWSHGTKAKVVSFKTQDERRTFLFAFFRSLRRDPDRAYRLDPRSLGRRHIEHAVRRWLEHGLSAGTIQCYLSYLRVFSTWIGKAGLVVEAAAYVDDPARVRRTYSATADKSWGGGGVDRDALFAEIDRVDVRVGAQLRMCDAFGLRVKEAIMIRPHCAVVDGRLAVVDATSCDDYLEVLRGTKGGRLRYVPIQGERQVTAVEHARRIATARHESLGHPDLRLHQALRRFYFVLQKCGITMAGLGVTAHGLRHGFAQRRYQDHTGSPPPIHGGGGFDPHLDERGRLATSAELGHARKSISNAYLGGTPPQYGRQRATVGIDAGSSLTGTKDD
jgi:integrase